jgi:hypothetical protein
VNRPQDLGLPDQLEQDLTTVAQVAGSVGGALVGLAMSDPVQGQIVGAAAQGFLQSELTYFARVITADRRQQAADALDAAFRCARQKGVGRKDFVDRAVSDALRRQLTGAALGAAAEATTQYKIRVLGERLATGVLANDDATIDVERLLINAIAALEPAHIRILHLVSQRKRPDPKRTARSVWQLLQLRKHPTEYDEEQVLGHSNEWTYEGLKAELPELKAGFRPLFNTLVAHSLIMSVPLTPGALVGTISNVQPIIRSAFTYRGDEFLSSRTSRFGDIFRAILQAADTISEPMDKRPRWRLTDFGERCLDLLMDRGQENISTQVPRVS